MLMPLRVNLAPMKHTPILLVAFLVAGCATAAKDAVPTSAQPDAARDRPVVTAPPAPVPQPPERPVAPESATDPVTPEAQPITAIADNRMQHIRCAPSRGDSTL